MADAKPSQTPSVRQSFQELTEAVALVSKQTEQAFALLRSVAGRLSAIEERLEKLEHPIEDKTD